MSSSRASERFGVLGIAIVALVVVATSLFVTQSLVDGPTKRDLTLRTINDASRQIGTYRRKHGALPSNIAAVSQSLVALDAWGHDLVYTELPNDRYVLSSLGPDGVRSGDDMAYEFAATDITTESRVAIP